jgi:hypothetical protein
MLSYIFRNIEWEMFCHLRVEMKIFFRFTSSQYRVLGLEQRGAGSIPALCDSFGDATSCECHESITVVRHNNHQSRYYKFQYII